MYYVECVEGTTKTIPVFKELGLFKKIKHTQNNIK